MTLRNSCSACAFFELRADASNTSGATTGICRFNPPSLQAASGTRGAWPMVSAEDWCGHFEAEVKAA
ncbi:MAG: hypothetical protein AAGG56_01095 [Pseudomonadota bacterium]